MSLSVHPDQNGQTNKQTNKQQNPQSEEVESPTVRRRNALVEATNTYIEATTKKDNPIYLLSRLVKTMSKLSSSMQEWIHAAHPADDLKLLLNTDCPTFARQLRQIFCDAANQIILKATAIIPQNCP